MSKFNPNGCREYGSRNNTGQGTKIDKSQGVGWQVWNTKPVDHISYKSGCGNGKSNTGRRADGFMNLGIAPGQKRYGQGAAANTHKT